MLDCQFVKENLYEYIYEELDTQFENQIREHMKICPSCNREYDKLKKLLIMDTKDIREVSNSINIPQDTKEKIELMIEKKVLVGKNSYFMSFAKIAAALCIVCILLFVTPAMAYIIEIPVISKYLDLDQNIETKFQEGKGQIIGKSDFMQGITFTVDGVIRKKYKTVILFTTKLDKQRDGLNYVMPSLNLGVISVVDQFGYKYNVGSGGITLKSVDEDGEAKCIFELDPLKPWAFKLNIKITAMELGYFDKKENQIEVSDKKNYGLWDVDFYLKYVKE